MKTFDRILVPLDGSVEAEQAIPHAKRLARAFGARLLLLRVLDTHGVESDDRPESAVWRLRRIEALRYLQGVIERRMLDKNAVDLYLREGRPAEQISDVIEGQGVGLVVFSAYGSGGSSVFPFGGTASKLLSAPGVSRVVVRDDVPGNPDEPETFRRILVPLDGSQSAEWALNAVCGLAHGPDAEIVLLQIVSPPAMPRRRPLTMVEQALCDQVVECNRRAATRYLDEVKLRLCAGRQLRTRLVVSPRVVHTIRQVAEEEEVDLIVLTSHEDKEQVDGSHESVCRVMQETSSRPVMVLQRGMRRLRRQPLNYRADWEERKLYESRA